MTRSLCKHRLRQSKSFNTTNDYAKFNMVKTRSFSLKSLDYLLGICEYLYIFLFVLFFFVVKVAPCIAPVAQTPIHWIIRTLLSMDRLTNSCHHLIFGQFFKKDPELAWLYSSIRNFYLLKFSLRWFRIIAILHGRFVQVRPCRVYQ